MKIGKFLWAAIYGTALIAFTVYACLDTFVIRRVYEISEQSAPRFTDDSTAESLPDVTETDTEDTDTAEDTVNGPLFGASPGTEAVKEPVITDNSYEDENIKITISEYRYCDTAVYAADVQLSSAEYLQTAFARSSYGKNVTEKTSAISSRVGAILAINGDYYGARERGYVIRSGVLYRSSERSGTEDLVICRDGTMRIVAESSVTAQELLDEGAYDVLSFGPGLISDGVITVTTRTETGQAMASNPRTAIGQIDELHYVFVVSDGRTSASDGLSLYELASFMSELGVRTAYNLDGGGSSTMVFNGRVVNNPTTNGRSISERSVSDIVYIGY